MRIGERSEPYIRIGLGGCGSESESRGDKNDAVEYENGGFKDGGDQFDGARFGVTGSGIGFFVCFGAIGYFMGDCGRMSGIE